MDQILTRTDQTAETVKIAYDLGADQIQVRRVEGHHPFGACDLEFKDLEQFAETPYRTRLKEQFIDVESFDTYYKRFHGDEPFVPPLFASLTKATVRAVFDYPTYEGPATLEEQMTDRTVINIIAADHARLTAENERLRRFVARCEEIATRYSYSYSLTYGLLVADLKAALAEARLVE